MTTCPDCGHQRSEHSSEPGVGCLVIFGKSVTLREPIDIDCPCLRPGISEADQ